MLGVLEGYWNNAVGEVDSAIMRHADGMYDSGLASVNEQDYFAARNFFEQALEYIHFPAEFYARHRELKSGGNPQILVLFDQRVLREDLRNFLKFESLNESAVYLVQGTELGTRIAQSRNPESPLLRWQEGGITTDQALLQEQLIRNSFDALQNEVESMLLAVNQKETDLRNYGNTLGERGGVDILSYIRDARSIIAGLRRLVVEESLRSVERYYAISNGDFSRRIESRKAELAEGNRLIQGIRRTNTEGASAVDHYPVEALAQLERMAEAIAADTRQGESLLVRYGEEAPEIISTPGVLSLQRGAQALMNELNSLRAQGLALSATARNQIAQAEAYRMEGERLFREAQAALGRQAFDTARERVDRAAERFNSSLAIQESAALRSTRDTQLVNLSLDINRIENELVIRDVRNLVNNARNAYFAGNFDQAEDMLVRAQNRWRVTNTGEEPEVVYWLGMIRGALSLRSGRVILPTAPLYPEMSQLLSEAKKDYEEGVRYFNAGQRSSGLAKFNDARQKTREVKLMFPVNQEAGILELMMERVTDTPAFDAAFQQRIRDAVSRTKQRNIEAFAELQNLAEINPRYPNIAAILNQAEIDMGYRPPPPNPRDIARSTELTASARRILDGNITTQFEVAMTQINEAIALNPQNAEATRVKDQLNYRMANPGSNILNSQDESKYQVAVQELQRGNNFVALSIVQEILQNPRNKNITKVVELQRRIQSQL
jgi:tetratricopeptide (TPR) repeat protein